MTDKLRIAIAQSRVTADVRKNGRHIREVMTEARQAGARLVHFAEGSLSGYVKSEIRSWDEVDWGVVREELSATMATAAELGIWTVVGCNHRLTPPNRPHNSLFVLSDGGDLVTRYDKRLCSNTEITDWYAPGHEARDFSVDGFKFGCALCIEVQFPEIFREYEQRDVDCVLVSAYARDSVFWTQAKGHAASNNIWVSLSVPSQCAHRLPGGLVGPHGKTLTRLEATNDPQFQIVELDRRAPELQIALTKARPWRRQARQGSIYPHVDDVRSIDPTCY